MLIRKESEQVFFSICSEGSSVLHAPPEIYATLLSDGGMNVAEDGAW
jgi:hypothetical protein